MNFKTLIKKYSVKSNLKRKKEIEKEIWSRFGEKTVVLVLDMSSFTKSVKKYGIVHYVSKIFIMQKIVEKAVKNSYGRVVKFEADNAFIVFKDPINGLKCVSELFRRFEQYNRKTSKKNSIDIKCGIDYGDCLFPTENDFFGDVVNIASKLGEDIAKKGEVLITDNYFKEVKSEYKNLSKKDIKRIKVVCCDGMFD